jgi:hypothetical protein
VIRSISQYRKVARWVPLFGEVLLALLLAGCIAIPHPRNVAMARGIETKKPKLEFLKTGATTRADMSRALGFFDTDASSGPLFWARWQQVKVQVEWAAGGYGGAGAGSERIWKIINVLATFDDNDVLTNYRICSERELMNCLEKFVHNQPFPAEFLNSLVVPASHEARLHNGEGRAIIEGGEVTFEESKTPRHNFRRPLTEIAEVTLHLGSSPELLRLRVHFRAAASPHAIAVTASPREAMQLFAMFQAAKTAQP